MDRIRRLNRPQPWLAAVLGVLSLTALAVMAVGLLGCSLLQPTAPKSARSAAAPPAPAPTPPPALGDFTLATTWDPGDLLRAVADPRGRSLAATLQPVASTERQTPPRVLIHDLKTGEDGKPIELNDPMHGNGRAIPLTFSPDGGTLAVGSTGRVFLLRADDGTQLRVLRYAEGRGMFEVQDLTFSPDGTQVIALVGTTLVTWDVKSGDVVAHWSTGKENPRRLAVNPDGSLLATGGDTGVVLRHPSDGSVACSGSPGRVLGVAFSPDGRRVAGWAYDGTYRMMDVDCANQSQWPGEAKFVPNVTFSGDGDRLLAPGNDGVLRAWDVATHAVDSSLQLNGKGPFIVHPFDHDRSLLVVDLSAHTAQIWKAP